MRRMQPGPITKTKRQRVSRRSKMTLSRIATGTQEHKYYDVLIVFNTTSLTHMGQSGQVQDLTAIPQGLGDTGRVGDKVTGTSLEWRLFLESSGAVSNTTILFRMIFFIWIQDDVPVTSEVLQYTGTVDIMISPFDHDRKAKRKILYETVVSSAESFAIGSFAFYNTPVFRKGYIPLSKLKGINEINYYTAGTVGRNKVYVAVMSDIAAQANAWQLHLQTRYNYIDA